MISPLSDSVGEKRHAHNDDLVSYLQQTGLSYLFLTFILLLSYLCLLSNIFKQFPLSIEFILFLSLFFAFTFSLSLTPSYSLSLSLSLSFSLWYSRVGSILALAAMMEEEEDVSFLDEINMLHNIRET